MSKPEGILSSLFLLCLHAHLNTIVVPVQLSHGRGNYGLCCGGERKEEDNILGLDFGEAPPRCYTYITVYKGLHSGMLIYGHGNRYPREIVIHSKNEKKTELHCLMKLNFQNFQSK